LPRSVGLGPHRLPPCLARTEQRSTTTPHGATFGPARTMRISTAWTRPSRAAALQPSRRRRRADLQARPTVARSSRHTLTKKVPQGLGYQFHCSRRHTGLLVPKARETQARAMGCPEAA
jgi:hypothetical protein